MSDPVAMATLRAQVFGVMQLFAAASCTAGVLVNPAFRDHGAATVLALVAPLVMGLWVLWRGPKLGDLAFVAAATAAQILALAYLIPMQTAGSGDAMEYGLLPLSVPCALFCARQWHVVTELATSLAVGAR